MLEGYIKIHGPQPQYNSGICKTLVHSKFWHIQNQAFSNPLYIQNQRYIQNPQQFKTLGYSEPEKYSEPCQTSTMECFEKQLTVIIIFPSFNHFRNISF